MKHYILSGSMLLSACALSGCLVGPSYKRPIIVSPPTFRDAEAASSPSEPPQSSLADLKWSAAFQDEDMKRLIAEALAGNYDLHIAAQRVLEQEAQVGVTRSKQFPTLSGGAAYSAIGIPTGALGNSASSNYYGGGFTAAAAWNLDFWGLYRRQTEAERAELLATEWGRRATISSVVTDVATAYIHLRSLDAQLQITHATLDSRRESLRLTSLRETTGAATMSDVHQSEQLLYAAAVTEPRLEREIRQQENDLCVLLGRNPGDITRAKNITNQPHPDEIPVGLPSQLLERRPDIQQAEARMIASNARIGVARAQFFPQISLTALGATSTSQLSKLFTSQSEFYFATGSITQSIFDAGKLKNNLKEARETHEEMIFNYRKTINSAFRDVSNSLIEYQKSSQERAAQEKQTTAAGKSVALARLRYENGGSSYLELLTNETNLFSAQLDLAGTQEQEAASLVQLYGALGGGWQ
jgi:multidrug efflux system outer membrane protein